MGAVGIDPFDYFRHEAGPDHGKIFRKGTAAGLLAEALSNTLDGSLDIFLRIKGADSKVPLTGRTKARSWSPDNVSSREQLIEKVPA